MKIKILITLMLFTFCCKGQILQKVNTYGYHYKRVFVDSLSGVPNDTLKVPGGLTSFAWLARKTNVLYIWSTTNNKWESVAPVGAGEANTASNLTGNGIGVWKDKSGVDLRFKRLKNVYGLLLTDMTDSVGFNVDTSLITTRLWHNKGLDSLSSLMHVAVTLAGQNYLSLSGQQITAGAINLSGTHVTSTLGVGNGGTGATTLTGILVGNGAGAFTAVAGTASQLLRRNAGNTAYEFFTPTYISGNETITLSGDVSGTGTTAITTTIGALKVATGMIQANAVTFAKFVQGAANTVVTNPTAALANFTTTALSANTLLGMGSTGNIAAITVGGILSFSGTVLSATEVDGSVSNELQTFASTSDATSHTVTLSNSGGSFQLVEGSNITLTTSGTGLNGIITIASTGGGTGHTIKEEGTSLTARAGLNFIGLGITATDDAAGNETDVTLHVASASQEGVVSTGTQTFAGAKTVTSLFTATGGMISQAGVASSERYGSSALSSNTTGVANTAVGVDALKLVVSGAQNTAVGNGSLINYVGTDVTYGNTALGAESMTGAGGGLFTGVRNMAIGARSLKLITTGTDNVGVGFATLEQLTTGTNNIAIGGSAGNYVTTSSSNTFIGAESGGGLIAVALTGIENTAVGRRALARVQGAGATNTAIGYNSGSSITTATGGVFIGYNAGANETTSNKLYIDNSLTATPLIYGEFDNDLLRINGLFQLPEQAAPGTPATGFGSLYPKVDGKIYFKNDGGTEYDLTAGGGDMVLASVQTNTGAKTFLDATLLLRNVANTFSGKFTNTITADRTYTLKDASGTLAFVSDITGTNSGTNTGDQSLANTSDATSHTVTLTGGTSVQFIEGTNITLTTGGTGGVGTVTIASTGSGYTNLTQFVDQTAWRLFYSNVAGDVVELALGAAGTFLKGNGIAAAPTWETPAGTGDMILASAQTNTGAKTFLDGTMVLRNVANTFNGVFTNTNTADRTYTLQNASGTLAFTSDIPATPGIDAVLAVGQALTANRTVSVGVNTLTFTSASEPALFESNTALTNSIQNNITTYHKTSGTVANGFGSKISNFLETTSGSVLFASGFETIWTTAADATRTSELALQLMNSAATSYVLTIGGAGQLKLNKYGVGTFTGTGAKALQVDASGNIIEVAILSGGGLGDPGGNGVVVRTALNTTINRTLTGTTNRITITNGDGVSGNPTFDIGTDVVTLTGSQTLTNKTLTAPVISSITNTGTLTLPTVTSTVVSYKTASEASNATPTPSGDARLNDHYITAQAAAAAFAAPSGTPTNGNRLFIRIKDNATARALSFDAIYRAGTDVPLPTTTVISKTMYLGFVYNSTDAKWDLIAFVNNI